MHLRIARSLSAGLLAIAILLGTTSCGGGTQPADPRAYPGSAGGMSLTAALSRYTIALPACADNDTLRYYVTDDMSSTLYLATELTPSCVDDLLSGLGMTPGSVLYANPFGSYEAGKFGWTY